MSAAAVRGVQEALPVPDDLLKALSWPAGFSDAGQSWPAVNLPNAALLKPLGPAREGGCRGRHQLEAG